METITRRRAVREPATPTRGERWTRRGPCSPAALRIGLALCLVSLSLGVALPLGAHTAAHAGPDDEADAKVTSKKAFEQLRRALQKGDLKATRSSLETIVRSGGGEAAMKKVLKLSGRLPRDDDQSYWALLEGAASFVDEEGLAALGDFLVANRKKPVARDLTFTLLASETRKVIVALGPLAETGPDDLRLPIIRKIGTLPFVEAVDVLIRVLEEEEKRSQERASDVAVEAALGLKRITGEDFSTSGVNWSGWWRKNRSKPELGLWGLERSSTGTAVDFLDSRRRREFIGLEKAPKKGVIVLSAYYKDVKNQGPRDLNNDHMEEVLERMNVPHEVVSRADFPKYDLEGTGAILINCAQFHEFCVCPTCVPSGGVNNRLRKCSGCNKHIIFKPKISDESIDKIRKFVEAGGYLFCEDWVVKEVVERAFPNFVVAGGKLRQSTVEVVPVRGKATHPYLEGLFVPKTPGVDDYEDEEGEDYDLDLDDDDDDDDDDDSDDDDAEGEGVRQRTRKGRTVVVVPPEAATPEPEDADLVKIRHEWTIDDESFALEVVAKSKVTGLLGSPDVRAQSKGNPLVALAFRPGKNSKVPIGQRPVPRGTAGVVVQVLSHFGKQHSREDEQTIENLLLNFLIDANVAREARAQPRKRRR